MELDPQSQKTSDSIGWAMDSVEGLKKEIAQRHMGIKAIKDRLLKELGVLKEGDIVEFDDKRFVITDNGEVVTTVLSTPGNPVWDIVYSGLQLKEDNKPYHDPQSGRRRRDIYQMYITKGAAKKSNATLPKNLTLYL